MTRMLSTALFALTASALTANGFDLVVYGAGVAGNWTTELTIANPNDEQTSFGISSRVFPVCPPGATCAAFVTVAANASAVVDYPLPEIDTGVGAAYIFAGTGASPAVLARAHVPATCSTVDLPVFHLAALRALDPTSLVLPGAVSGSHGRSNLVVANVPDPGGLVSGTLMVAIEALSEDGAILGESQVTVAPGETLFLQDIVAVVGGPDVDHGQVRLTKLAGTGVMWAVMPITRSDGSVSVSAGQPP